MEGYRYIESVNTTYRRRAQLSSRVPHDDETPIHMRDAAGVLRFWEEEAPVNPSGDIHVIAAAFPYTNNHIQIVPRWDPTGMACPRNVHDMSDRAGGALLKRAAITMSIMRTQLDVQSVYSGFNGAQFKSLPAAHFHVVGVGDLPMMSVDEVEEIRPGTKGYFQENEVGREAANRTGDVLSSEFSDLVESGAVFSNGTVRFEATQKLTSLFAEEADYGLHLLRRADSLARWHLAEQEIDADHQCIAVTMEHREPWLADRIYVGHAVKVGVKPSAGIMESSGVAVLPGTAFTQEENDAYLERVLFMASNHELAFA